jgi:hypothetical protein
MIVQISKKIGKSTFTFKVEGEKEVDALSKAAFYATTPDVCGLCQSENVSLDSNKAKGFTFVKIKCLNCNARSNMGQFKDGSGTFWKEWDKYTPPDKKDDEEDE